MPPANIYEQLIRDEGNVLKMYTDTVGKKTIGVGHNLDAKAITWGASMVVLADDVDDALRELETALPWVKTLSEVRRAVLINMSFNLGIFGLLGFKNTLEAVRTGRYTDASNGMLNSLWARQVGVRAIRLAAQMRTNVWQ